MSCNNDFIESDIGLLGCDKEILSGDWDLMSGGIDLD
jgi:hypothetical protein